MPQDDLVSQLTILYRAAGQPSFRRISNDIRERDDMPDTVSHETVSGLLSGDVMPRWSKVECVVRILAEMAAHQPDPQLEVQRFLALWTARNDSRSSRRTSRCRRATRASPAGRSCCRSCGPGSTATRGSR